MWKHPERGLVKANFDAAKKGNGIGVIFRDCKGDPHVAEALAFQFSTKIASQLSITVASYETDCQFLHKLEKKKGYTKPFILCGSIAQWRYQSSDIL